MKTVKNAPKVESASKDATETLVQTPAQDAPKIKTTKKSIVIEFLDHEGGSTIKDIAQAITDRGLDLDLDKNSRVVRLWISKIGFKVDKKEGKYFRAI